MEAGSNPYFILEPDSNPDSILDSDSNPDSILDSDSNPDSILDSDSNPDSILEPDFILIGIHIDLNPTIQRFFYNTINAFILNTWILNRSS